MQSNSLGAVQKRYVILTSVVTSQNGDTCTTVHSASDSYTNHTIQPTLVSAPKMVHGSKTYDIVPKRAASIQPSHFLSIFLAKVVLDADYQLSTGYSSPTA